MTPSTPTNVTHPVEAFLALPFVIMGLSHMLRPEIWERFFTTLHGMGANGVILRSFALELWPAAVIVAFHQEWRGAGLVLTLYGHALMFKLTLSLFWPALGLRSLAMAERHGAAGFRGVGAVLCALGVFCLWRLNWPLFPAA